jgi:hypothetical protein
VEKLEGEEAMINWDDVPEDEREFFIDPYLEVDGKMYACTTYCENAPPRVVVLDSGHEFTDAMVTEYEHHKATRKELPAEYLGSDTALPRLPPDSFGGLCDCHMTCRVCGGRARIYPLSAEFRKRKVEEEMAQSDDAST